MIRRNPTVSALPTGSSSRPRSTQARASCVRPWQASQYAYPRWADASLGFNSSALLYSSSDSAHFHCFWYISARMAWASANFGSSSSALRAALVAFGRISDGGAPTKSSLGADIGSCQSDVSGSKRRVHSDRILEVSNALFNLSLGVLRIVAALYVALIHFGCHRARGYQPGAFLARNRNLDLFGDRLRHLTLQSKHVLQLAIIFLRPEVLVRPRTYQLRVNPNPVAFSYHRSFNKGIYSERLSNFRHGELRVSKTHHRGA